MLKDLSGLKFGKLTVTKDNEIRRLKNGKTIRYWKCICDCGNELWVRGTNLTYGTTKSCNHHSRVVKHGMTGSRIYNIYYDMLQRCQNRKNTAYKYYGERGIKVCEEWLGEHGFENFYKWAIENGYSKELTIDRIDVNNDYLPYNCRWVTMDIQSRNKRNTIKKIYNGKEYTLSDLIDMGVEKPKFSSREKSWNEDRWNDPYPEKRIVNYNGTNYNIKELSKIIGIPEGTLNTRYTKGFSDNDIIKRKEELRKLCPVIQMDDYGNVIGRFNSIKEASEKTGIRKSGINMCCNGQRKHCGGYVWKKDVCKEKIQKTRRSLTKHKGGGWDDFRGKIL